jgi:hypothetical protein
LTAGRLLDNIEPDFVCQGLVVAIIFQVDVLV